MFKNKNPDGSMNLCGHKVYKLRKCMYPNVSQQKLAEMLQLAEIDLDKNAIQRIEAGKRHVTDIELNAIANTFNVSIDELLRRE